jgi:tRNA A37 threonylcarbamoyladenosine synthetase subunit TsaC/SUA5/YrdC
VGVRIVPEFEELISETGPLFTTSANIHGEETPEEYEKIVELFKDKVDHIQEGKQKSKEASKIISFINDDAGEVIR